MCMCRIRDAAVNVPETDVAGVGTRMVVPERPARNGDTYVRNVRAHQQNNYSRHRAQDATIAVAQVRQASVP